MKTGSVSTSIRFSIVFLGIFILLSGCSTVYYGTWEKLGKHKRDLLRDNVEDARDEQAEANESFKDALTRLRELREFDGGDLEDIYDELNAEYESAQDEANDVKERIDAVDEIANDLFEEWQDEIALISNSRMKADSRRKLEKTKTRYAALYRSMTQSEKQMDRVLLQFRDHVLYLKHNLNAQAIGAIAAETSAIESDISSLIKSIDRSIEKADVFIKEML